MSALLPAVYDIANQMERPADDFTAFLPEPYYCLPRLAVYVGHHADLLRLLLGILLVNTVKSARYLGTRF